MKLLLRQYTEHNLLNKPFTHQSNSRFMEQKIEIFCTDIKETQTPMSYNTTSESIVIDKQIDC